MRNLLEGLIGREIDVSCGNSSITGKVIRVQGEVLQIEKDDVTCYINIDKIVAVWDSQEKKSKAPGFTVDHSGGR